MTRKAKKMIKKFNGSVTFKKPEKKLTDKDIIYICSGSKLATGFTIDTLLCCDKSK